MTYIYEGNSSNEKIIAMINDYNSREVIGMTSYVLVSFEGKFIREGAGNNGEIIANLDGDFIREGDNTKGKIIAVIKGNGIKQCDNENQLLFIEGIASKIEKAALTAAACMLKGQL